MDELTWSKSSWREDGGARSSRRSSPSCRATAKEGRGYSPTAAHLTRYLQPLLLLLNSKPCPRCLSYRPPPTHFGLLSLIPRHCTRPLLQWATSSTQHLSSESSSSPSSSYGVSLSPAWSTISLPPSPPVYAITLPCPPLKTPWRMASPLPPSTCPTI